MVEVVKPATTSDVIAVVREARARRLPLFPVSTNRNWGYGPTVPPDGRGWLVDLSAMTAIRNAAEIGDGRCVALIEPGVTQGQLADFLAQFCPELTFNVTGSARETSIIGNALDRGVGYFGPRREDLFGLEVVTGAGQVVRTGFRRLGDDSPLAATHPYGLGPMLDGLFFQGNFGIVTSACLRLMPRRPKQVALSMALTSPSDLPVFLDRLLQYRREGLVQSVTHVGNRARTRATLVPGLARYFREQCAMAPDRALSEAEAALPVVAPTPWTALAAITGNAAQVGAAVAEVRQRLRPIARVRVVTDALLDFGYRITHRLRFAPRMRATAAAIAAIRPLHGLTQGVPTDAAVDALLWQFGDDHLGACDFDRSKCGLVYISPALPGDGAFVASVVAAMEAEAARFGHELGVTINVETGISVVAVTNIVFDRTDQAQAGNARACVDALLRLIRERGLEVYRAHTDMMDGILAADPEYWRLIRELKRVFDPDNIIAPGRYCPVE